MPDEPKKKKTYRYSHGRKPSLRQIRAARLVVENGGNVSKSMRDAGYSPGTAENPKKLTESKAWPDLLAKFLPQDKIAKVHAELLEADRPVVCDKEITMFPDNDARARAVDLGHKLYGAYAPEQINITRRKYQDLSNEELAERMKKAKDAVTKK